MFRMHRYSTTCALVVCLVGSQWSPLIASQPQPPVGQALAAAAEPGSSSGGVESLAAPGIVPAEGPASNTPDAPAELSTPPAASPFIFSRNALTATAPLAIGSAPIDANLFTVTSPAAESTVFAQRGWGRGRGGRNSGAQTAIILGAAATIAGAAILIYANRPECSQSALNSGCGYGSKVVGGAVLSGGVVSMLVGALAWR